MRPACFAFSLLVLLCIPNLPAETSVSLTPSGDSPAAVGTIVTWRAFASDDEIDDGSSFFWYRFQVRRAGGEFQIIRDFGPESTLNWTSIEPEGEYEMEVSVQNRISGQIVRAIAPFHLTAMAQGNSPVLAKTPHPLVVLYSAPACPAGSRIRVSFQPADGVAQRTQWKGCAEGLTTNFYLAGLKAETGYEAKHTIETRGQTTQGPAVSFRTDAVTLNLARYTVAQAGTPASGMSVLLQSALNQPTVASDLSGNILWYYVGDLQTLTSPGKDGSFYGIAQFPMDDTTRQILRKFDLLGLTMLETNAARINEQLAAMGKRPITGFHHEVRELPDGKLAVLANAEQFLTDVQDEGSVDVLGDVILVLDSSLRVVWVWDAFEHLDPARKAVLSETCTPSGGGCPPFYLASRANDWLHANAVHITPDGNLLVSLRHQDWVIKIDYQNGNGDGHVIWRLGQDGDFSIESNDPNPWFSHQHDAHYVEGDDTMIVLFDNGNGRRVVDATANSRGQAYRIDEQNRTATLVLNADLGGYSGALGSAQKLANGNYHFLSGFVDGANADSIEVDPGGNIVYRVRASTQEYRSFRMKDLYTPPN